MGHSHNTGKEALLSTLIGMLPNATAEQREWLGTLTPEEMIFTAKMVRKYPKDFANPERLDGWREEMEYTRNF